MSSLSNQRVLFVQPFSLAGSGGGARILTSMIKGQLFDKRSIDCLGGPHGPIDWIEERSVPMAMSLGRLGRTRFAGVVHFSEIFRRPFFERSLAREMDEWKPDVVHVIPHWSYDFHVAWRQARARGCRVVMSVHDDLRYTLPDKHPFRKESLRMLGEVWRDVDHVFAISQELGEEYNARYGKRSFEIITDGLASIPDDAVPMISGRLNVYFMGLFHYCYRENLRTLTRALARIKSQHPDLEINLSMRCGALEKNIDSAFPARALPFADQATVRSDMTQADLLYLPLPIGAGFEAFTRYSLSTKMVSYLGSGVPIVYHGPRDSAAAHLLIRNGAALVCDSLDDLEMIAVLDPKNGAKARSQVVENALKLARTSFPLEHLRHKFLKGIFP